MNLLITLNLSTNYIYKINICMFNEQREKCWLADDDDDVHIK